MADTQRTLVELLAIYADNQTGQISAQDGRDLLVSIMSPEPKTKIDDYEVQTTDFGIGKVIRMNAAILKTFTFAALTSDHDGYIITFSKQGAGDVTIDAGALNIGDTGSGEVTNSGGAGAIGENITLQYNHSTTMLEIINIFGTWAEAV